MNTMHNLLSYYNNSNEEDIFHTTLGNIFRNWDRLEHATMNDICQICAVSPATISRMTKKLGYRNFTEFRYEILAVRNNYSFYNRVLPLALSQSPDSIVTSYINNMRQILSAVEETIDLDMINKIADDLHAAKRIRFYSYGKYFAEAPLQINLMRNGKDVLILVRHTDQLCDASSLDDTSMVVLYASEGLESIDMEPILKMASEKKARVLLFSSSTNTPFMKYADYTIVNDATPIKTMISSYVQQIYLDIINTCYRSKYIDKVFGE